MRTTITLDDDLALQLRELQEKRKQGFKELLNEVLREGLARLAAPPKRRKRYRTPSADLGPCLVGNVDNVAEALAIAEGEDFK